MAFHGVLGISALYGTVAAEATSAVSGGSSYVDLGVGSSVAIGVALIGLYGNIKRRRAGGSDEDVNALSVALTVQENLATFRTETNVRLAGLEQRTGAIEDHVRPWPRSTNDVAH